MMMSRKAAEVAKHENKFIKCVKTPFRILGRAKDFYVRALTDCSGRMSYGGSGAGTFNNMPRSFSVTSSSTSNHGDEDFSELIRAASQRGLLENLEFKIQRQQQQFSNNKLPRSFTVGIERIDEDKPCEFDDDFKADTDFLYPRSRSHAVPKRNRYAL